MGLRVKSREDIVSYIKQLGAKKLISIAVLTVIAVTVPVMAFSYGSFASVQPEDGTLSGGASSVADAGASGGSSLRFGSGGASRCPAYPAFPDENCTGVIAGSTLNSCSSNINTADATYTNCEFSNLGVLPQAKNVTISNSRITGAVYCATSGCEDMNITFTDVEISGGVGTDMDAIGGIFGYTCIRCHLHDHQKGFAGGSFHIEDSYVHDIYGYGASHNEAVLPFGGHNNTLLHNNIVSDWSPGTTGGGMSAAIALYTHGTFWGSIDNVLIEKNRIVTNEAYYCMYGGYTDDTDGSPSNLRVVDNIFGPCSFEGPEQKSVVIGWLQGNGNVWSNNRWYSDNSIIAEPTSGHYNQ